MIHNERQYRISRIKRQEFIAALDQLNAQPSPQGLKRQVQQQALASQIEAFDQQIARYEYLVGPDALFESLHQIERLPELLIELRLAAGLNHKALGALLGIHEEQVRRYEATGYSTASLHRVLTIFEVCRQRVREHHARPHAESAQKRPPQPPSRAI